MHPNSDVDRLYTRRKDGGRGLIAIEDCVELAVRSLEVYVHGSEERLIQAARVLQDWEEKALHGHYLRQTKEVRSEQSWVLLENGDLKRETESLILAAQNQSIRTKLVKAKIGQKPERHAM